jgi:hypothetical protein
MMDEQQAEPAIQNGFVMTEEVLQGMKDFVPLEPALTPLSSENAK